MRDYAERIEKKDALQAHPEYLNEQIDDHDKAIYAKGWNDCNKEYYNAITELPVASIDCTDLSARLRRTFEADELVNHRILLDAADAIEELLARDVVPTDFHERCLQLEIRKRLELEKQMPHWISVEDELPELHVNDSACVCTNTILYRTQYKTVHLGYVIETAHNIETIDGFEQIIVDRWYDQSGDMIEDVTHWMPLPKAPEPPKVVE